MPRNVISPWIITLDAAALPPATPLPQPLWPQRRRRHCLPDRQILLLCWAYIPGLPAPLRRWATHLSDHLLVAAVDVTPRRAVSAVRHQMQRMRLNFASDPQLLLSFQQQVTGLAAQQPAADPALLVWWPGFKTREQLFAVALIGSMRRPAVRHPTPATSSWRRCTPAASLAMPPRCRPSHLDSPAAAQQSCQSRGGATAPIRGPSVVARRGAAQPWHHPPHPAACRDPPHCCCARSRWPPGHFSASERQPWRTSPCHLSAAECGSSGPAAGVSPFGGLAAHQCGQRHHAGLYPGPCGRAADSCGSVLRFSQSLRHCGHI